MTIKEQLEALKAELDAVKAKVDAPAQDLAPMNAKLDLILAAVLNVQASLG